MSTGGQGEHPLGCPLWGREGVTLILSITAKNKFSIS